MSLEYIRNAYGVPAKRGGRVEVDGRLGTITRGDSHIWVRFDGGKLAFPCHPTWRVRYLDGEGRVVMETVMG